MLAVRVGRGSEPIAPLVILAGRGGNWRVEARPFRAGRLMEIKQNDDGHPWRGVRRDFAACLGARPGTGPALGGTPLLGAKAAPAGGPLPDLRAPAPILLANGSAHGPGPRRLAAAFLHGLAFAKPAPRARRHGGSAGPASDSGSKLMPLANSPRAVETTATKAQSRPAPTPESATADLAPVLPPGTGPAASQPPLQSPGVRQQYQE